MYDSERKLLNKFGPNPPECRQVWITDISIGIYYYSLEIKLTNLKKPVPLPLKRIVCGREAIAPVLTYTYTDFEQRERLSNMAFRLIKIRDKYE